MPELSRGEISVDSTKEVIKESKEEEIKYLKILNVALVNQKQKNLMLSKLKMNN